MHNRLNLVSNLLDVNDSLFPILITGAAGFIGSHLYRTFSAQGETWGVDNFSHPTHPHILQSFSPQAQARLLCGDTGDISNILPLLTQIQPKIIFHLAAQTHVDRAIDVPQDCVLDNIQSTLGLLQAVRQYYSRLPEKRQAQVRLIMVSTDEVYGSVPTGHGAFDEQSPTRAGNPYSASKVACEQLALAWKNTYDIPVLIARCSNNFGTWQHAEKLIARTVLRARCGLPIEIYGNGSQVREWLHVEDHVRALKILAQHGRVGEIYNISGSLSLSNLELVKHICHILNEWRPSVNHIELIRFVADRPGHDQHYAINGDKIYRDCQWQAESDFQAALRETVLWYAQECTLPEEYVEQLARQGRISEQSQ